MTLLSLSLLPFSAENGWPMLAKHRPAYWRVFAFLVLPLSLLPPVMLYFAGTHHPEAFPGEVGAKDWSVVAPIFFLAEMLTLLLMGWLIKQLADSNSLRLDYHGAYLLASIAPVPMWLSSLGLLWPNPIFSTVVALAGLGLSCSLVYNGIEGLCSMREDVTAASIAQVVIGAGLISWAVLLVVAFA